jgi:hypothetical protein
MGSADVATDEPVSNTAMTTMTTMTTIPENQPRLIRNSLSW